MSDPMPGQSCCPGPGTTRRCATRSSPRSPTHPPRLPHRRCATRSSRSAQAWRTGTRPTGRSTRSRSTMWRRSSRPPCSATSTSSPAPSPTWSPEPSTRCPPRRCAASRRWWPWTPAPTRQPGDTWGTASPAGWRARPGALPAYGEPGTRRSPRRSVRGPGARRPPRVRHGPVPQEGPRGGKGRDLGTTVGRVFDVAGLIPRWRPARRVAGDGRHRPAGTDGSFTNSPDLQEHHPGIEAVAARSPARIGTTRTATASPALHCRRSAGRCAHSGHRSRRSPPATVSSRSRPGAVGDVLGGPVGRRLGVDQRIGRCRRRRGRRRVRQVAVDLVDGSD